MHPLWNYTPSYALDWREISRGDDAWTGFCSASSPFLSRLPLGPAKAGVSLLVQAPRG